MEVMYIGSPDLNHMKWHPEMPNIEHTCDNICSVIKWWIDNATGYVTYLEHSCGKVLWQKTNNEKE